MKMAENVVCPEGSAIDQPRQPHSIRLSSKSCDSLMEAASLDAARTDPNLVLVGEEPHLIDEWQEVPAIWDAARNRIDRNANRKGELILTGSARPKDEGMIRHSGTGRIARLRMRPMALCESDPTCGGVSFAGLFDGEFTSIPKATTVQDVARWCRSRRSA